MGDSGYDDILELLSTLQESLNSIDNKIDGLDTRLQNLESRPAPPDLAFFKATSTADAENTGLNFREPISHVDTQKTIVTRIEKKVDDLDLKISQIALDTAKVDGKHNGMALRLVKIEQAVNAHTGTLGGMDLKLDLINALTDKVDQALDTHDKSTASRFNKIDQTLNTQETATSARFDAVDVGVQQVDVMINQVDAAVKQIDATVKQVDAAIKQIDATVKQVNGKADQIISLDTTHSTTVKVRFDNLDRSVAGLSSTSSAGMLRQIDGKADQLLAMEKAHKLRDEIIYMNTVVREMNKHIPKTDKGHMVLHDINDGSCIYTNWRDTINSSSSSSLKTILGRLGIPDSIRANMGFELEYYWGYLKGGEGGFRL